MKKTSPRILNAAFTVIFIASVAIGTVAEAQVITAQTDARAVGSTVDLTVSNDGSVTLDGTDVVLVAGSTFYTRVYWGDTYLRILVRTTPQTVFTKKYGEAITVGQISLGDFISVTGTLNDSAGSLDITAATIKDWSIQTQSDQFSGTITGYSTSTPGFIMQPAIGAPIHVSFGTTTLTITKGSLSLSPSDVKIGDKVTSTSGIFDHVTNTLTVNSMDIYQDMSIFNPQNFQGTLASVKSTTLPTTLSVVIKGQAYTVNVPAGASVLNNARQNASLGRFLAGDAVRIYGSIEQKDHLIIDATILRNTSI